jgi:hypothetical protein
VSIDGVGRSHLLLAQLVRKVGNHNLGGAGNSVLGGTTLLLLGLALESSSVGISLSSVGRLGLDVGRLNERKSLTRNVGRGSLLIITGTLSTVRVTLDKVSVTR